MAGGCGVCALQSRGRRGKEDLTAVSGELQGGSRLLCCTCPRNMKGNRKCYHKWEETSVMYQNFLLPTRRFERWHKLSREVVESATLEMLATRLGAALPNSSCGPAGSGEVMGAGLRRFSVYIYSVIPLLFFFLFFYLQLCLDLISRLRTALAQNRCACRPCLQESCLVAFLIQGLSLDIMRE